jgi:hypothetical protein
MLPIPIVDTQSRSRKRPSEAARSALDSVASRPPDEPTDHIDESEPARTRQYLLLSLLLADPLDAVALSHIARIRRGGRRFILRMQLLLRLREKCAPKASTASSSAFSPESAAKNSFLTVPIIFTGFFNEHPLARLRDDLRAHGEPSGSRTETEDHVAILCHHGHAEAFFHSHLAPWAEHFFADLECAEATGFYRHLAKVESLFIQIEKDAFAPS